MPDQTQDSPFLEEQPRFNNFETEERALEAQAILHDSVVRDAMTEIYSRAVGTLVEAEVGSLTAGAAHAMMKAVLELKSQLEQYVTDNKIRQKYNKGDK
jgi:hypothetical protein